MQYSGTYRSEKQINSFAYMTTVVPSPSWRPCEPIAVGNKWEWYADGLGRRDVSFAHWFNMTLEDDLPFREYTKFQWGSTDKTWWAEWLPSIILEHIANKTFTYENFEAWWNRTYKSHTLVQYLDYILVKPEELRAIMGNMRKFPKTVNYNRIVNMLASVGLILLINGQTVGPFRRTWTYEMFPQTGWYAFTQRNAGFAICICCYVLNRLFTYLSLDLLKVIKPHVDTLLVSMRATSLNGAGVMVALQEFVVQMTLLKIKTGLSLGPAPYPLPNQPDFYSPANYPAKGHPLSLY